MTDPRRLVDDELSSDAEHRALAAARRATPKGELVNEVWSSLAVNIPPVGGGSPAGGASSGGGGTMAGGGGMASVSSAAATLTVGKAAALGALLGGLVTTGVALWTGPASTLSAAAPLGATERPGVGAVNARERSGATKIADSPTPATEALRTSDDTATPEQDRRELPQRPDSPATPEGTRSNVPSREGAALEAAAATSAIPGERAIAAFNEADRAAPGLMPGAPAGGPLSDDARAEVRLVGLARDALRAGDAARAMGILEEAQRRYPSGIVSQEREALAIEALVRLGNRSAALGRAGAFMRNFPSSPHAARVKTLVSGL